MLHLLLTIPKFPNSASDCFIFSGRFKCRIIVVLQFTVLPYFAEPGMLVRVNFVPANKMCTSDQFKEERGL